uniref:Uncharacterized protein n=1 Tax=Lepeophtheirus salmonis TaxID=72036 RepID=A0A0K2U6H6_LEPSM
MLTVEELTNARKENLPAVREVEDLEERVMMAKVKNVDLDSQRSRDNISKGQKIKLEIEDMKFANETFMVDKVSQPSNDKEMPREDTSLEMGSTLTDEETSIDGNNIELTEERMRTKYVPLLEEGTDNNISANDSDGARL